jgi:hypothetical protein
MLASVSTACGSLTFQCAVIATLEAYDDSDLENGDHFQNSENVYYVNFRLWDRVGLNLPDQMKNIGINLFYHLLASQATPQESAAPNTRGPVG